MASQPSRRLPSGPSLGLTPFRSASPACLAEAAAVFMLRRRARSIPFARAECCQRFADGRLAFSGPLALAPPLACGRRRSFGLQLSDSPESVDSADLGTVGNNARSSVSIALRCDASTTCVLMLSVLEMPACPRCSCEILTGTLRSFRSDE